MQLPKTDEIYAKLLLSITDLPQHFELSDKPDLQNIIDDIGIEVTRAETTEEGQFRHLWCQHVGKGLSSNEFKEKLRNPKYKQQVIPNCDGMAADLHCGLMDDFIIQFMDHLYKKSKKFNQYTKFKQNGLFVFTDIYFRYEEIHKIQNKIKESDLRFDFYIIFTQEELYIIDSNKIVKYPVTQEQRHCFYTQAKEYHDK